jgi:hypothetical protein
MKRMLMIVILLAPLSASADYLDVFQGKLKEGCTLDKYVAVMNDFNERRTAARWESDGNVNGLPRQYFPKGTDLSLHTATELDAEFVVPRHGRERFAPPDLGAQTPTDLIRAPLAAPRVRPQTAEQLVRESRDRDKASAPG